MAATAAATQAGEVHGLLPVVAAAGTDVQAGAAFAAGTPAGAPNSTGANTGAAAGGGAAGSDAVVLEVADAKAEQKDEQGQALEKSSAGGIMSTSAGTNTGTFGLVEWGLFWSVGCIWGSSFLLMDIGLEAFKPGLITWLRVSSGAAILALHEPSRKPIVREDWPRLVALSILWVAVPFTLFPIAQQWVSSAVTGMLCGAVPIFAAGWSAILMGSLPGPVTLLGVVRVHAIVFVHHRLPPVELLVSYYP